MKKLYEILLTEEKTQVISVNVPLFIRLLEYAREDAKTDLALHNVAENAIRLMKSGQYLDMDDYSELIK